ncbi:MAG: 50S ribosomal protein L3 [Candidatus Pacebacteria bacterium]|nr:50S ribosomal protein L3 [Candidatus Paceibacterota bacterium]
MKFILGEKKAMTQVWKNDEVVAVTTVKVDNCVVSAIKEKSRDGYSAICLGLGQRKAKNIKKPQLVRFKKLNIFPRYQKEFRIEEISEEIKEGDKVSVTTFKAGDKVFVTGISKGRGFQGVVKRHGFAGTKATHGNKDQLRMGGSIGSAGVAHVFKGLRMPGRMGGDRITVKNLEIVDINEQDNLIYIKGAIPGHFNGLVMIKAEEGDLVILKEEIKEEKQVDKKEETAKASVETESKEETESIAKKEDKQEEKVETEEKTKDKDNDKKETTKDIKESSDSKSEVKETAETQETVKDNNLEKDKS